ncbi:MAG: hypothetical protein HOK63_08260 [Thaumarchaeota archaeon]|jgi:hypothetical protein|nr:hypothetical protein [Nitrososphaerota archaeon]MBT5842407.1 hypothetical protein [Nitrososphaerota archaeon]MBT6469611.1 hypothetical protein [Nitrososphaerota archaeon]
MKICNICHKISGTGQNHIDCVQKRNIESEDAEFKNNIAEKLNLSNDNQELGVEVRALLEHMSKEKDSDE